MKKNNQLPIVSETNIGISEELGGGSITLSCIGDFGIAPIFLKIGGIDVTGIATVLDARHQPNEGRDDRADQVHKWVHNDKSSARKWLTDHGATQGTVANLMGVLQDRLEVVTAEGD